MAELVAEAFLSAAFQKILERLTSREFVNFFRGKKSIDEQLKVLKEKIKTASLLLNDAEDRQMSEPDVKQWLDELKHVTMRAEDLVEDVNDEARTKREQESGGIMSVLMKSISPTLTEFDKTVLREVESILEDLNFLLDRAGVLCLEHVVGAQTTISSQRWPAPLLEESHVYGRNDDKEKVLKLVLSNDRWGNKIGVIPIVGMGGLGKTTLAQLVYNDNRVKEHGFHVKAWVTVSIEFDIFRIMNTILQKVDSEITNDIKEPEELQRKLGEALRGKKFLFVLDDVWDENYSRWNVLKSTFTYGDCGSKIIVTTRSKKVASIVKTGPTHELKQILEEDCWKIFVDHAFNGSDPDIDPPLKNIGEKIVKKCKGLPLAVQSVGGLLRSERDIEKWETIVNSRVWCESQNNDILPSLWLSYVCLPSCLKQCFAYCSIFPEDHEFEKEKIILLWMAEGFLPSNEKEKPMDEFGKDYFDCLVSRSLFQRSNCNESKFMMHDLVHDLATFVSGEFNFMLTYDKNLEDKVITSKTRRLSYQVPVYRGLQASDLSEAKHLRTFIEVGNVMLQSHDLVEELLRTGSCLRVLSLCGIHLDWNQPSVSICTHWSMSFNNVKHLRYLNLSGSQFKEIHSSICTLYNLQTLLLVSCRRLTRLPKDMGRLIHLRHLDTRGTPLEEMPPQMGNLKELRTLTDFVLGQSDCRSGIEELGALQHLAGKLRISGLQNIVDVGGIQKANYLMDKKKLTKLDLRWEGEVTDTIRARDTLNALQPHTNLTKLIIRRYAGSNFPNWLGDSSFSKIVSVDISGNEYCFFLPPLGQLPSLQKLVIKSFHGVEKIGDEFYGAGRISSITPFQSLQILEFSGMKRWKVWSFIDRDGKERQCFPCLKELWIDDCPNLAWSLPDCVTIETLMILSSMKSMESLPLNHFSKLKHLHLRRIENLKELIVESPNVIETLSIRDCNKLEFSGGHCYEHIKELTIKECASLKSLPLDYFPRLEVLDLTTCQNLESLTFTEETGTAIKSPISELFINDCKNFRSLPEHTHKLLPSLARMALSDCPEIESFPKGGLPPNLNELEFSNCCKLVAQHRHWNLQGLTSLRSLGIYDCEDTMLDSFPEGWSIPSSLTSFSLSNLPHLKTLNGGAFKKAESLAKLSIYWCTELQFLPDEILSLTSLRCLEIMECPFLERRYRRGKGEDWHKISQLQELRIKGKTTRSYQEKNSAFANF